jgi:hypothetical protein
MILGVYCIGVPPLPIPNREVKPDCADGTADWWESRSTPTFKESYSKWNETLFLCGKLACLMEPFGTIHDLKLGIKI